MITNKPLHDERGGSILEILITLGLIAIALPSIIQLYSYAIINSSGAQLEAQAANLCEQKMEEIITDKMSISRGYTWVTTSGRYPAESLSSGFSRTVSIDTTGKSFSGVSYALVTVSVNHSLIPAVQVTNWLTRY